MGFAPGRCRSVTLDDMVLLIVLLLLALILIGAGFAVHLLWWGLIILVIAWLVSLVVGRGPRTPV